MLINIGAAVAESMNSLHLINAVVGFALMLWVFQLKYDDTSSHLPAFIVLYTLWNIHFHYIHVGDAVSSFSHTLIPAIIGLYVFSIKPSYALRAFALARSIALATYVIHYASPVACHAQGVY